MKRYLFIIFAIPFLFQNQLSGQVARTEGEFNQMLEDLYSWTIPVMLPEELQANGPENYTLLDARERPEFEVSHLPAAQYIGYNQVEDKVLDKLPKDKPVVVYCSVGYRSEKIGEKLKSMGFSQVYNLYGGIFEWKHKGYAIEDDAGKPTEKVHAYNKDWGQWLRKGEKVY